MSGQVRWSTVTGGLVRVSDDDPDVLVPVAAPAINPFLAATDESVRVASGLDQESYPYVPMQKRS